MPTSLQYPLELDRRLLRRWQLLRTATPIKGAAIDPLNALLLGAATGPLACALADRAGPSRKKVERALPR